MKQVQNISLLCRVPVIKAFMRRPKVGEVVMSLSGSPLLNLVDDIPEKPGGVALSLGGGKVSVNTL